MVEFTCEYIKVIIIIFIVIEIFWALKVNFIIKDLRELNDSAKKNADFFQKDNERLEKLMRRDREGSEWHAELIKRGYMIHDPVTGVVVWAEDYEKSLTSDSDGV